MNNRKKGNEDGPFGVGAQTIWSGNEKAKRDSEY